jgi:hypothetical protein
VDLKNLKFIKNIDDVDWAYKAWKRGSLENLHWSKDTATNANRATQGDQILLVQKPNHLQSARITHLVEVVSPTSERIDDGDWGIIRQVSVLWVANFEHESCIPKHSDIFGWKRQRNQGTNLIELGNIKGGKILEIWHSPEIFQRHVAGMLGLIEEQTASEEIENS